MTITCRRWGCQMFGRTIAGAATFTLLFGSFVTSNGCSKKEEEAPPTPVAAPSPPPAPAPAPPRAALSAAPAPLTFGSATLGSGVLPDKRVVRSQTEFGPKDTIYASIETMGAGKGTLKAVWTSPGKKGKPTRVGEDSLTVDLDGTATQELHASKKAGWKPGSYDVEIFLNDKSVAKKSFVVK